MKRSMIAIALVLGAALASGGCANMAETGKTWTANATGANDPNDTSLTAKAGRLSISNINASLDMFGIKPAAAAKKE